jgi:hypothetical protein
VARKKASTRVVRTLRFRAPSGEIHRIRVSMPRGFFGTWRLSQARPRRTATASVFCGRKGRVMVRWSWPKRDKNDRSVHGAMLAAVETVIGRLAAGGIRPCRPR